MSYLPLLGAGFQVMAHLLLATIYQMTARLKSSMIAARRRRCWIDAVRGVGATRRQFQLQCSAELLQVFCMQRKHSSKQIVDMCGDDPRTVHYATQLMKLELREAVKASKLIYRLRRPGVKLLYPTAHLASGKLNNVSGNVFQQGLEDIRKIA